MFKQGTIVLKVVILENIVTLMVHDMTSVGFGTCNTDHNTFAE